MTGTSTSSFQSASNNVVRDHRFQIKHDLLYEREFERGAYVSAHLQHLQNGCFTDSNLHTKDTLHVTFAAITFTFHPVTSAGSSNHRFESAVIEIVAKSNGLPLRFLKHAPHLAFGRISSTNLKWNFSLGATVGVLNSPAGTEAYPSIEYERDTVVGTMMKIQGSTRSSQSDSRDGIPNANAISPARIPDTRLIWTLEENTQQKAGIPREFTFVFLMERPVPPSYQHPKLEKPSQSHLEVQPRTRNQSTISTNVSTTPMRDRSPHGGSQSEIMVEQSVGIEMVSEKSDFNFFLNVPEPFVHSNYRDPPGNGMIDNLRAEATRIAQKFYQLPEDRSLPAEPHTSSMMENPQSVRQEDEHDAAVFKDITFSIAVKPDIAGMNVPRSPFEHHAQHATVHGEVGQKFSAMAEDLMDPDGGELGSGGLYNFTKLPVRFEELIELPGSTVTTVEPTLPPIPRKQK